MAPGPLLAAASHCIPYYLWCYEEVFLSVLQMSTQDSGRAGPYRHALSIEMENLSFEHIIQYIMMITMAGYYELFVCWCTAPALTEQRPSLRTKADVLKGPE